MSSGAGTGPGEVVFDVQPNPGAAVRSATIAVGDQSHTVSQAAAAPACTYSLNPASTSISAGGGEGRFAVATQANCAWSASTGGTAWISLVAGSGSGPGEVVFTTQANTASQARTGAITVADQSHSVTQAAAPCTYSLNPATFNAPAAGGEGRFTVVTQAGCPWSVSGGSGWITIGTPQGSGQGDVVYTVQANTAAGERSASILVSGQAHTVIQAGAAAPPPPMP